VKQVTIISGERIEKGDKRGKTTVAEKHKLCRKHKLQQNVKIVNFPLMHLKIINK
jgi:hypothetical protein